jgi:hypothetical protein
MHTLRIPADVVESALSHLSGGNKEELGTLFTRRSNRRFVELIPTQLNKRQALALWKVAKSRKSDAAWKDELEFVVRAARDPSALKVRNVRDFLVAFKSYVNEGFIKGWLFERAEYGALTPFLITEVAYSAATRHSPEYATVSLTYTNASGENLINRFSLRFGTLITIYKEINREAAEARAKEMEEAERELEDTDGEDDKQQEQARRKLAAKMESLRTLPEGIPIDRILAHLGYYKENQSLHSAYEKQLTRFMRLIRLYGAQVRVRGDGVLLQSDGGRRWHYGSTSMLVDGRPSRAILDTIPFVDSSDDSPVYTRNKKAQSEDSSEVDLETLTAQDFFASKAASECPVFDKKNADDILTAPLRLNLRVFHLEKHEFYSLHVVNIAPYQYKPELSSMLILPPKIDRVAKMLMAAETEESEDIIEGKSQGKMITCIGDPGLGKTLLAEVMSEVIGKPLYKIQAAQLGLDPEVLEERLQLLLRRAERWGCILMIDEANAYIHDRGVDVTQNAIVGVFLRLLEYFRGTIILTTNQTNADGSDMDIDDAILSRSNAVIHFDLPTTKDAVRMWEVQRKLLKAEISDETIAKAVSHFKYSGRSIRQLLRLAWGLAKFEQKSTVTFDMLKEASEFIAVSRTERRATAK